MVAAKKQYSVDELKAKYHDITALYDHAEELVATVESQFVANPEQQLDIVEPLIAEIGEATDTLSEEFMLIAESFKGKGQSKVSKSRVESALRKIYVAVADYQARVRDLNKRAHGAIQNIADPIVSKIQRQIEQIVVIFLEFIQISLHNVMNKMEVEALRVRDARVALMMHQQALTQHQG